MFAKRLIAVVLVMGISVGMLSMLGSRQARGQGGILDHFHRDPNRPRTMVEIARAIDCIEDKIRDDGIIGVKQPDVWTQARMTKYRRDFEKKMLEYPTFADPKNFHANLQGTIARADSLSIQGTTTLAAALNPVAGSSGRRGRLLSDPKDIFQINSQSGQPEGVLPSLNNIVLQSSGQQDAPTGLETTGKLVVPGNIALNPDPFGLTKANNAFQTFQRTTDGKTFDPLIGVEPTVAVSEFKDFIDTVNEFRRVNMGDDTADSAGYSMYL